MKKKIVAFALILMSVCFFADKSFCQPPPGGSAGDPGGGTTPPPDQDITFDLGTAGTIDISASSPYYSFVTAAISYFHITITNGVVTFPTLTCYTGCLTSLYHCGCINSSCYHTACKNPPPGCH